MTGRNSMTIPPVTLPERLPDTLPEPRFQLRQNIRWNYVPSQDFGRVLGIVFGSEGSVKALGYHYAIALDSASPSYSDGITSDWGFEENLELLTANHTVGDRLETSA